MEQYRVDEHVIALGDTQSGKTTTSLGLCAIQNKFGMSTIFVNTKSDKKLYNWDNLGRGAAKYKNVPVDVMRYLLDEYTSDGIIEVRPEIDEGDLTAQIEPYIKEVISFKKKNHEHEIFFAIDEFQLYQSKHTINRDLKLLFTMGKGLKLYCGAISQRPTAISNDVWTQAEVFYVHALNQRDCVYLYDNRYLSVPKGWTLAKEDPNCTYPFWNRNQFKCFFQRNMGTGLNEIKLKNLSIG